MTWPSHDLTPQQTSRHQNTSLQTAEHHHHGTAEGSFTAKKWFGHRAGRSPCAHSIGKFFLWYIYIYTYSSFPFGNFRPRLVRALLVINNAYMIWECEGHYRGLSAAHLLIDIPEEVFLLDFFFVIPTPGKKLYDPNNFLRRYCISLDICSCSHLLPQAILSLVVSTIF